MKILTALMLAFLLCSCTPKDDSDRAEGFNVSKLNEAQKEKELEKAEKVVVAAFSTKIQDGDSRAAYDSRLRKYFSPNRRVALDEIASEGSSPDLRTEENAVTIEFTDVHFDRNAVVARFTRVSEELNQGEPAVTTCEVSSELVVVDSEWLINGYVQTCNTALETGGPIR